jgi:hypothetical protein
VGRLVRIMATTRSSFAACPGCGSESRRVHSRYERRLLDTAAGGCEVVVCLAVRRFLCLAADCAKVTFAEQVDGLTSRHARRTPAVTAVLEAVALALGGRAGARLSGRLAAQVSRMTLLRLVRALPDPALSASPRVLGVDFAMRELTPGQSDDLYELIGERTGKSLILTSNRAPQKAHMFTATCARQRLKVHGFGWAGRFNWWQ